MLRTTLLVFTVLLGSALPAHNLQPACDHTQWILSVLRAADAIKPGMTRQQLLTVFEEEGGISTRMERTYVYKECPYIKVKVEFQPVGDVKSYDESPADKIVKISEPFIEYGVMD